MSQPLPAPQRSEVATRLCTTASSPVRDLWWRSLMVHWPGREALPPPPNAVVVGAFTVHLRAGLNRMWFAQIADNVGHRTTVRGRGREGGSKRPAGGAPEP